MRRRSRASSKAATARSSKAKARKAARNSTSSASGKETEVARLTRELHEAQEQQTATAEVLKIVSTSATELQSVLEVVVRSAARFCQANDATILELDGQDLRVAAHWGAAPQMIGFRFPRTRGSVTGRTVIDRKPVHVIDLQAEAEEFPEGSSFARRWGHRTTAAVPLLREGVAVGTIMLRRTEVNPFTDKQTALLQNFAAQAVIAIENARLLNELRESLQQQTATADVLKAISSSPGELEPVFQTMLENAVRICEANFGTLFLRDVDVFRAVATHNAPPAYVEALARAPIRPPPDVPLGIVAATKQVAYVADITTTQSYIERHPFVFDAVELGGYRSVLAVPVLKDNELVGSINILGKEVRPFTDKQIELVKNFAAQAVIAIENTRLLNELRESLQQQTATADVLKVISRSTFNLQAVLQTLVESAARLSEADKAVITRQKGAAFYRAESYGYSSEFMDYVRSIPIEPERGSVSGRALLEGRPVHIPDVKADPEYTLVEAQRLGDYRTALGVPMLREGIPIGVLSLTRSQVRPFTDKQIELVTTFTDQAVIAIENARLFEAEQQRTRELSESLDQQTATSEVLRVISSSPGELEPVFQAMLENATRICEAKFGTLQLHENGAFRVAAMHNPPPAYAEARRHNPLIIPSAHNALGRVIATKRPVHIADYTQELAYRLRDPLAVSIVELAGARTLVIVPMLKEGELIGNLLLYRQEVRPFTETQIALLTNFAAQAVIAIENTRLLNELRQRTSDLTETLEQQTATSKVLEVISRSAFDLQAVFEAVAESSVKLCGADRALVFRFDGELLRIAVAFNAPQELKDFIVQNPFPPGQHNAAGRAALERRTVQIADPSADPEYSYGAKDIEKIGTILAVPILKGEDLLGVINIFHLDEVRLFTDRQIALVETFADQAAIAIDNVRLLDELRQSLQQQTATADVLKVISRSTFDLQVVLNTLVESAAHLCGADMAVIIRREGEGYRFGANFGYSPEYAKFLETQTMSPGRGTTTGRAVYERTAVQIADVTVDPEYAMPETYKLGRARTVLSVPLLRENEPIGTINLARQRVEAFTEKQIGLATTFADQAVIAIENVRLFDEIQDKSRQLAEASQHKSQFLANMSHELRTPLNAILGYTELMTDGAYGEPSEKMLGILKRLEANGRHLLGLINDVLDLSKIEAGQLVLELSDYCIEDIAQTVRSTLEPLAADKKLGFKVEIAPQLPSGHGDGRRLTQVLINLVGNAIKFTDAGEIAIKAEAHNGSFHVSVRDTGPGISSADQAKLFQEFQQADNAITKKKGGTGLGLAISKRIIEMHGGRIWVESQPGQGSTFTFTLPVIVKRQVEAV